MKSFRNVAYRATVYGQLPFDLSCEKYVLTYIAGNLTTSFLSVGQNTNYLTNQTVTLPSQMVKSAIFTPQIQL